MTYLRILPTVLESLEQFLEAWFILTLAVGLAALLLGGNLLVDGAVILSRRFGLSTLLIGLTVVSFGTSAPELAFNIIAALEDRSALSFGNIVGSNIANLGLVLGLAAVAAPLAVHNRVVARELPIVLIVSLAMVAMYILPPDRATDQGMLPAITRNDGLMLMGGFVVFLWLMARMARTDRSESDRLRTESGLDDKSGRPRPLWRGLLMLAAGFALLLIGGKMSALGATSMAQWAGVGDVVIALVIIAIATSLPEVATSVIAARRGHADLAVGNVMGSNIFNVLLVMGVTAVISPVEIPEGGMMDLIWMCGITVALGAIVLLGRRCLHRWGGGVLLALYAVYLLLRVLGAYAIIGIPEVDVPRFDL